MIGLDCERQATKPQLHQDVVGVQHRQTAVAQQLVGALGSIVARRAGHGHDDSIPTHRLIGRQQRATPKM
jgi:hypothetical protein